MIHGMEMQRIVQELLSTGLTQKKLADLVPCSQSLISALADGRRGKNLSYQIGLKLISLLNQVRSASKKPPRPTPSRGREAAYCANRELKSGQTLMQWLEVHQEGARAGSCIPFKDQ